MLCSRIGPVFLQRENSAPWWPAETGLGELTLFGESAVSHLIIVRRQFVRRTSDYLVLASNSLRFTIQHTGCSRSSELTESSPISRRQHDIMVEHSCCASLLEERRSLTWRAMNGCILAPLVIGWPGDMGFLIHKVYI